MTSGDEQIIADLIQRIQVFIFPRRVRVREFFLDFDPLRSGRCTKPNFKRAITVLGLKLSDEEMDVLAEHFTDYSPQVQKPQVVHYVKFCEMVEEVFVTVGLEKSPAHQVLSPGQTLQCTFRPSAPLDDELEEQLDHILYRVATLCKTRGIHIKYCYQDLEKSASTIQVRNQGKVLPSQFVRHFPFRKEFSDEELDLILKRYLTDDGNFHFMALHNDVSEVTTTEPPPYPRSDLILRPDNSEWDHHTLDVVSKLQSKVVEKRLRLIEHFKDFDRLRKGLCTVGQVKTVFTIANLDKEIGRNDFDDLCAAYTQEDGMFRYQAFCAHIDEAFTTPGLEKDPQRSISMPDATTTAPARRNRMTMTADSQQKVEVLEEKIRSRIRVRRMLLKPTFKDMDRINRGHVTKNQFARAMCMSGFDLDEKALDLLASVYCDLGNRNDFNYLDFLKSTDCMTEEEETAMIQHQGPHVDFEGGSQYFDARGNVAPLKRPAYA